MLYVKSIFVVCFMCVLVGLTAVDKLEVFVHRLLSQAVGFLWGTCIFPLVGLKKSLTILVLFSAYVIVSARPTYTLILVDFCSQRAPPYSGEMSWFCDLCSALFSFVPFQ